MRTITINIYSFDELSEKAKEKAIEKYRDNMVLWDDEIIATIKAIADAMECFYDYHSYDGVSYSVSFEYHNSDDSLSGLRAWAFIENNFVTPNEKSKTYYLHGGIYCDGRKNWSRKSKINYTLDDCPFTGYCADCCFIEAWREWKKNFTIKSTVEDFIDLVAKKLSEEWTTDNEYQLSDDGIIETIEANDYEFLEDGKFYYSKER